MDRFTRIIGLIEKNSIMIILRKGFLAAVPFLIIGSFCLLFAEFPLAIYQDFIHSFADGFFYNIFSLIYKFTSNSISLVLIATIAYSYASKYDERRVGLYLIVAFSSYCLFVCGANRMVGFEVFEASFTLTAILITLLSCTMLKIVMSGIRKKDNKTFQSFHYDLQYVNSLPMLIKIFCVIAFFALVGLILGFLSKGNGIENICGYAFSYIFKYIGRNYFGIVIYVILVHILWFFGINGENAMQSVNAYLFKSIEAGEIEGIQRFSSDIFTPAFFDTFVNVGGSGVVLALVITMVLFASNKNNKRLGFSSILPSIFNISEPVIYGLPIIFNPVMIIPFIIVPVVTATITAVAVGFGFVPVPVNDINWTTPLILSGYLATGSVKGAILQLVNLAAGVLIYLPFLRKSEEPQMDIINKYMPNIINIINECENMGTQADLLSGSSNINIVAHKLLADMYSAMDNNEIYLCYQPQINDKKQIIGAEGLLRWKHPACGFVYPPLVIHLAYEDKCLYHLTMKLIDESARALQNIVKRGAHHFKMSVNISTLELKNKDFCSTVEKILSEYDFGDSVLAFEITERLALSATPFIEKTIEKLRAMGIEIIMDDFGMGHSSMSYLQDNKFSYVKIDGALVKQILTNERSCDIVETVCELSQKLGFEVIAEYVETEQQRDKLLSMGCRIYQGYLYSPAISFDALIRYMEKNNGFRAAYEYEAGTVNEYIRESAETGNELLDETAAAQRAAAAMHAARLSRNERMTESQGLIDGTYNSSAKTIAALRAAKTARTELTEEEQHLLNIAEKDELKLQRSKEEKEEIERLIAEQAVIDHARLEKSMMKNALNMHHYDDYKMMHSKDKSDKSNHGEQSKDHNNAEG